MVVKLLYLKFIETLACDDENALLVFQSCFHLTQRKGDLLYKYSYSHNESINKIWTNLFISPWHCYFLKALPPDSELFVSYQEYRPVHLEFYDTSKHSNHLYDQLAYGLRLFSWWGSVCSVKWKMYSNLYIFHMLLGSSR
jgi:hypothetical protein